MTLLFRGRNIASDATEGLRSGSGAKTTTHLLLDLDHPQIALGQVIVKGHGKVVHKGQCLGLVPLETIQQVLAFMLFWPALTAHGRSRLLLFCRARLQKGLVALRIGGCAGSRAVW